LNNRDLASDTAPANISNWRSAIHNRWAFHHVDRILSVGQVDNDPANIIPLESAPGSLRGRTLRNLVLATTGTDAIVVLQDGKVVLERYSRGNEANRPHILMSATKSVMGLLAGILTAKGIFDTEALVSAYLPEMAHTAYQGATIRHLLDMRTGVELDSVQLQRYESAINWGPHANGQSGEGLASFYQGMTAPLRPHGGPFRYVSANTDLLGWAIERATGLTIASLLSSELWKPLGAQSPAFLTLDRKGLARSTGGLCVTARDFARLGQLLIDEGRSGSRQIVPLGVIEDIVGNGDANAWKIGEWGKAFAAISTDMRYRSGWYIDDRKPKTIFAMGIYGQNLFVDLANRIVVAKLSSWNKPIDYGRLWLTHRGYERLQRALIRESP
jgi:CubicO group peptidase (beta-lactamase class C family)